MKPGSPDLYFLIVVRDSQRYTEPKAAWIEGDRVELFLDFGRQATSSSPTGGRTRIAIGSPIRPAWASSVGAADAGVCRGGTRCIRRRQVEVRLRLRAGRGRHRLRAAARRAERARLARRQGCPNCAGFELTLDDQDSPLVLRTEGWSNGGHQGGDTRVAVHPREDGPRVHRPVRHPVAAAPAGRRWRCCGSAAAEDAGGAVRNRSDRGASRAVNRHAAGGPAGRPGLLGRTQRCRILARAGQGADAGSFSAGARKLPGHAVLHRAAEGSGAGGLRVRVRRDRRCAAVAKCGDPRQPGQREVRDRVRAGGDEAGRRSRSDRCHLGDAGAGRRSARPPTSRRWSRPSRHGSPT